MTQKDLMNNILNLDVSMYANIGITTGELCLLLQLKQKRKLYSIIKVCYGSGILQIKSEEEPEIFVWNTDFKHIYHPSWLKTPIKYQRRLEEHRNSISICTQTVLNSLNTRQYNTPKQVANVTGVNNRRVYEILNILSQLYLFKRRKLQYRKRKITQRIKQPVITIPDYRTVINNKDRVETRSAKKQRLEQEENTMWRYLKDFSFDPNKKLLNF